MKIAVMQPYFMPYIGYFQLINAVDRFVIFDDVNYINKGWINRNRILIKGEDHYFTIPLKEASQNKLIHEIEIADDNQWKKKFLKTIHYNYNKAPFYKSVFPLIDTIINHPEKSLSRYILESIIEVNRYLGIRTLIIPSSAAYGNGYLKGLEKIMDICLKEKATTYINPLNGTHLYSKAEFNKKKIELFFLKSGVTIYPQFNNSFIPWLSIIDVLMFNPAEKIQEMLNRYELI